MRGYTGLLLLLPLVHATPLMADLEGSRYMSEQLSSNTVPRIGRRASSADDIADLGSFLPHYPYPHLLRESQSWSKVGKRSDIYRSQRGSLPNLLKLDYARLGKRGPPSFSLPDSWRSKKRSPLSIMRDHLYPRTSKRSAQPKDQWTASWAHQLRGPQGFRLHDGDLDYLTRTIMYKRAEDPLRDLNSVPFIGKRTEENKSEDQDDDDEMLVRVPREDSEDEETNPWQYVDIASQLQDGLMM